MRMNVTLDCQDAFMARWFLLDDFIWLGNTRTASKWEYYIAVIRPAADSMPLAGRIFDAHCLDVHCGSILFNKSASHFASLS